MKNKQFAILVTITFLVGMIWLITDIIFNTKASISVTDKLQILLEPVNPTFNARVLEVIDKETLDRGAIIVTDALPAPVSSLGTPVQSSTPEPTLNPSIESSPSGRLDL
jgi:hypothetical protein